MGAILRGSTRAHQQAVEACIDTLQSVFGKEIFLIKQITGHFQRVGQTGKGRFKIGIPGMGDIGGWVSCGPLVAASPLQIEVKTGMGEQSGKQILFQNMCIRTGAPYLRANFRFVDDLKLKSIVLMTLVSEVDAIRTGCWSHPTERQWIPPKQD